MARTSRKSSWHRTKTGCWTCSLGERGKRVRLFQKRRDGAFYREIHIPGEGRDQAPLRVWDKETAERLGRELLALLTAGQISPSGPVRLGELWERYQLSPDYLDNAKHTKQADISKAKCLLGYFGELFDVRALTPLDISYYSTQRKKGGVRLKDGVLTKSVRQRAVHADLSLLRRMLRWACIYRLPNGRRWLDQNPIEGMRFEKEKNPMRAVATIERYEATCKQIHQRISQANTEEDRLRWIRLEMALCIAESTGRRRGAIAGLRWEDFDFIKGTVTWRAVNDKSGRESIIPMPADFWESIRLFRKQIGAVAGPLFPKLSAPDQSVSPDILTRWLEKAEKQAELPKLPGSTWHAYRRKWASERMHFPIKAVADAGGWSDVTTLQTCYQQTDESGLLAVMGEPIKRSERKIG